MVLLPDLLCFDFWADNQRHFWNYQRDGICLHHDTSYGGDAQAIYNAIPALQPLDIVYGLCLIALTVYQFVVRSALAKKKTIGPAMLNKFFVASAVISCLRTVVFMVIVGISGVLDQTRTTSCLVEMASSVVVAVIMIVAHNTYFAKRQHVFAN